MPRDFHCKELVQKLISTAHPNTNPIAINNLASLLFMNQMGATRDYLFK